MAKDRPLHLVVKDLINQTPIAAAIITESVHRYRKYVEDNYDNFANTEEGKRYLIEPKLLKDTTILVDDAINPKSKDG